MGNSPETRSLPILSFIGHHNAGKTQILTRVIEELTQRGLRVGTVKHAPHHTPDLAPDTDSARLHSAGAHRTVLWGRDQALMHWGFSDSDSLVSELPHLFFDCDLILLEGYKSGPFPKIEVYRRGAALSQQPLAGAVDVIAVITDEVLSLPDGLTRFSPSDVEAVCDYVESRFLAR